MYAAYSELPVLYFTIHSVFVCVALHVSDWFCPDINIEVESLNPYILSVYLYLAVLIGAAFSVHILLSYMLKGFYCSALLCS